MTDPVEPPGAPEPVSVEPPGVPEPAAVEPPDSFEPPPAEPREPRPIIERVGLAAVALVLALLFGGVAAASWVGGEPFLAVMAGVGCVMTVWVGALTLIRG